MKKFKFTDVLRNSENPRFIRDEKFNSLIKSILVFPKMMELRPITIDELNVTLGGNMRYEACKEIGSKDESEVMELMAETLRNRNIDEKEIEKKGKENLKIIKPLFNGEFPEKWINQELNLTDQEKKEFILKDNSSFGEWDMDMLTNQFEQWELDEAEIWTPLAYDVDIDDFFEEKEETENEDYKIVLVFSKEEMEFIEDSLKDVSETKEEIFINAIKK